MLDAMLLGSLGLVWNLPCSYVGGLYLPRTSKLWLMVCQCYMDNVDEPFPDYLSFFIATRNFCCTLIHISRPNISISLFRSSGCYSPPAWHFILSIGSSISFCYNILPSTQ